MNDRGGDGPVYKSCSNRYTTFTPFEGAQTLQATERGLGFFEELTMTALLYRGHSYEAPAASPKACVELTYRREHYNTCREKVTHNTHPRLTYRGASYTK